jgi:anti-anti-sigma regulatory factor
MLRVTPMKVRNTEMLKLEGKLCGPWVDELQRCLGSLAHEKSPIRINLREVSFLDDRGRELLLQMERQGTLLAECSDFIRSLLYPDGRRRKPRRTNSLRRES